MLPLGRSQRAAYSKFPNALLHPVSDGPVDPNYRQQNCGGGKDAEHKQHEAALSFGLLSQFMHSVNGRDGLTRINSESLLSDRLDVAHRVALRAHRNHHCR
jgi:hypothetical protein